MSLKPQPPRPMPAEIAAWGATHLHLDSPYRMVMMQRGTTIVEQHYNGDGVLVVRSGMISERYSQDLLAPLSQMLQITHGSTTTNYVYGRERLFAEQNGVRSWYANDALGSARVTLSDAGVPSEPASYDPWGKGGSATFGFTGEFQDTTDLVYLRARWYDPRSATFISRDPFEGYAEQLYDPWAA